MPSRLSTTTRTRTCPPTPKAVFLSPEGAAGTATSACLPPEPNRPGPGPESPTAALLDRRPLSAGRAAGRRESGRGLAGTPGRADPPDGRPQTAPAPSEPASGGRRADAEGGRTRRAIESRDDLAGAQLRPGGGHGLHRHAAGRGVHALGCDRDPKGLARQQRSGRPAPPGDPLRAGLLEGHGPAHRTSDPGAGACPRRADRPPRRQAIEHPPGSRDRPAGLPRRFRAGPRPRRRHRRRPLRAGHAALHVARAAPRKEGKYDENRADVFSMGVTLFEAVTLQRAFHVPSDLPRPSWPSYIVGQATPSPRKLSPNVPRDLAAIIEMAMDPNPSRRYESASALADDLASYSRGEPVKARVARPDPPGLLLAPRPEGPDAGPGRWRPRCWLPAVCSSWAIRSIGLGLGPTSPRPSNSLGVASLSRPTPPSIAGSSGVRTNPRPRESARSWPTHCESRRWSSPKGTTSSPSRRSSGSIARSPGAVPFPRIP